MKRCNWCGIGLRGGRFFSEAAPARSWCSFECSADDPYANGGPWGIERDPPDLANMARAVCYAAFHRLRGSPAGTRPRYLSATLCAIWLAGDFAGDVRAGRALALDDWATLAKYHRPGLGQYE